MKNENYYLGLDIGTDSVGYAVTDTTPEYALLKHRGEPMWGVTLFDPANTKAERRGYRTARRRLDRRRQRVLLVQELFAKEIAAKDKRFYSRIKESGLLRTEASEPFCLFNDVEFTDKEYHKQYPTIHHLLRELINSPDPHDVRLVYIACAWLVAHRGHFLNEISPDNVDSITDFKQVYEPLMEYFKALSLDNYSDPWIIKDINELEETLKKRTSVTAKHRSIIGILFPDSKCPKGIPDGDVFPFEVESIIKLLVGGTVKLKSLYGKEEYAEIDPSSVSLGMDEEKWESVLCELGDDSELLIKLKAIYDWSVLCDLLRGKKYISESKVMDFEQHAKDLKALKTYIKKYAPEKYNNVFRRIENGNYTSYSGNTKSVHGAASKLKRTVNYDDFGKFIKNIIEKTTPEESDVVVKADFITRIGERTFLPKQATGENRVIPYQLYYKELEIILKNASSYLPFLNESDSEGFTNKEKLLSIMSFRVPYYVGPLNQSSQYAWIKKKADGRIYPWDFSDKVDLEASEEAFIKRMTNTCTYISGEDVLPKHSLLYEEYEVLNEINKIRINGIPISAEAKRSIYDNVFLNFKKVSPKRIKDYLVIAGFCNKEEIETISGLDISVKSSLSSHHAFKRLLQSGALKPNEVEDIINRATYSTDRLRFRHWLNNRYSRLSEEDKRYISSLSFNDFGRLSHCLLSGIQGVCKESGEINTIIGFMRNSNVNLMELLSDRYSFSGDIARIAKDYYAENPETLDERLDSMYISNAVKRPIYRTLDIIHDVVKATGRVPEKIFIEMARGGEPDQKGKRTKSRKEQIIELYERVRDEDVKLLYEQLNSLGETANSRLQSESLFLYFIQLGKCMYSGEPINIEKLGDGIYNIDHIYPQSKVKDDSILNNKVLVLSKFNKDKGDDYPVPREWRNRMHSYWSYLREAGLITEEKFSRLTRATSFTSDEEFGFINRQLVETRQSTKAIAAILKEKYPDTKIVYVKAGLVSDFRHDFGMIKCRSVNDLHHAKDAYLNIVCGNVYTEHFTEQWFKKAKENNEKYNIKLTKLLGEPKTSDDSKTAFNGRTVKNGEILVWNGQSSFESVARTMQKNSIHMSKYAFCRKGGLFDQQPLSAAEGLVPRKRTLKTLKYGGYNKPTISFFILSKYTCGKKTDLFITPVELMYAEKVLESSEFASEYIRSRIASIVGKHPERIEFPLGMRPIKINTVFALDGFEYTLSGTSSGGKCIIMEPFVQLILSLEDEYYIKKLESVCEKAEKNTGFVYNEVYDKVNKNKNLDIYDKLCGKINSGKYNLRINAPAEAFNIGKDAFVALDEVAQARALLCMLQVFGRVSGGVDLTLIGGKANAAATSSFSTSVSNWKKKYKTAFIIDRSASGIWEKRSENLLEML